LNLGGLESMDNNITQIIEIAKTGIQWLDWLTIVISTLTMLGVVIKFFIDRDHRKKAMQKIPIKFLVNDTDKYLLDLDIMRQDISRAEIQGLLSAFQNQPSQRYTISSLSDISFLDSVYKIKNETLDELIIKLSTEEFIGGYAIDQHNTHKGFNLTKMKLL